MLIKAEKQPYMTNAWINVNDIKSVNIGADENIFEVVLEKDDSIYEVKKEDISPYLQK